MIYLYITKILLMFVWRYVYNCNPVKQQITLI